MNDESGRFALTPLWTLATGPFILGPRIDLRRVGVVPETRFMSTRKGKSIAATGRW